MKTIITFHVLAVLLWAIGVVVLGYAATLYNPSTALMVVGGIIYGLACAKLFPWVTYHTERG